jgi:hypothetical protein
MRSPACPALQWNGGHVHTPGGLLMHTHSYGIMECGPGCRGANCARTRIVSGGLRFPLEVG